MTIPYNPYEVDKKFIRRFHKIIVSVSIVTGVGGAVAVLVGLFLLAGKSNAEFGIQLWIPVFIIAIGVICLFTHFVFEEARVEHERRL